MKRKEKMRKTAKSQKTGPMPPLIPPMELFYLQQNIGNQAVNELISGKTVQRTPVENISAVEDRNVIQCWNIQDKVSDGNGNLQENREYCIDFENDYENSIQIAVDKINAMRKSPDDPRINDDTIEVPVRIPGNNIIVTMLLNSKNLYCNSYIIREKTIEVKKDNYGELGDLYPSKLGDFITNNENKKVLDTLALYVCESIRNKKVYDLNAKAIEQSPNDKDIALRRMFINNYGKLCELKKDPNLADTLTEVENYPFSNTAIQREIMNMNLPIENKSTFASMMQNCFNKSGNNIAKAVTLLQELCDSIRVSL